MYVDVASQLARCHRGSPGRYGCSNQVRLQCADTALRHYRRCRGRAATGNGGKNALPHDHNRDWSDQPHWNETIAAQTRVLDLINDNRMDVFLDLHNPAPGDPTFFFILSNDLQPETTIAPRDRFIELAYGRISKIKPLIPMSNKPRVTGPNYHPLWRSISANWVAMHGNPHTVSLCLETVWNYQNSTTEGYRAVGAGLAAATREYLGERSAKE